MGGLETFVAIDVETTGLDPEQDEIIEVGAVRVREGAIERRFEHLVSSSRPIPPAITRLTGISNDDCAGQPSISSILPRFLRFLEDDPVVAHNAPFDLSFLNHQMKKNGWGGIEGTVFDTLTLSRILLPRLRNHQLSTLLSYFQIPTSSTHRAGTDAEYTAKLFLTLQEYVEQFELDTLQTFLALTPRSSPLSRLFSGAVRGAPLRKIGGRKGDGELQFDFTNRIGRLSRRRRKGSHRIDIKTIEDTFSSDGPLSRVFPHYEERPQQVAMAREVVKAFNNSECLIVEAGTGVGKTLAYLVPAVHWALENGDRVIVSTKTKNLQEQLFFSDIPLLRDVIDRPFTAVLLKGRSNYLCLNKWYRTLAEANLGDEERIAMLPLVLWLKETVSGDISENTGFRFVHNSGLWNRVCAESLFCLGGGCKYKDKCFYQKVRGAAHNAHIVVTNHALLLSDVLMDHAVLDAYHRLILDEAHTVEKVATQHFGRNVTIWRVRSLSDKLWRKDPVETGLLPTLVQRVERAPLGGAQRARLRKHLEKARDRIQRVRATAPEYFRQVTREAFKRIGEHRDRYTSKVRYGENDNLLVFNMSYDFLEVLTELCRDLTRICTGLGEIPESALADLQELVQEATARVQECEELMSDLSFVLMGDDEGFVYWVEVPSQDDHSDARLCAAPLEIGELMTAHFYEGLETTVLTSATLTTHGRFDYVLERLGLDPERTVQFRTGSPFRFEDQALVCVPSFLPSPWERSFQQELGHLIKEVVLATRRGTMALFTSYDMLTSTYNAIQEPLEREGIRVLGQGVNGSRSHIMSQFKREKSAILMGTESFWEGVDLLGEELTVLFLVKLPFAVPTEPLVEAQIEAYERRGLDPFQHYSVPEAVMKFKQGFGRLIRSREDRGVALVCDTRVLTSNYGRIFLKSLPTKSLVCPDREALLSEITRWLPTAEERND
ncbi:MAG: DEAD/DEAH box helicase [Gemmatimonadota bacterium]|nr:MAG: DEAD/DEAH box helicase [Gemmatimonadota bacterium]